MIGHEAIGNNCELVGRGGLAKGGEEGVNQCTVCEEFLSAARAKGEEEFLEAEVGRLGKAIGGASKIDHGLSGGCGQ